MQLALRRRRARLLRRALRRAGRTAPCQAPARMAFTTAADDIWPASAASGPRARWHSPAGPAGLSCPDGYDLKPLPDDADTLVCRRSDTGASDSGDGSGSGQSPPPQAMALEPNRRQDRHGARLS